jgi:hypothetical protein
MCDDCESQWGSPEAAKCYENAFKQEVLGVLDASDEDIINAAWITCHDP